MPKTKTNGITLLIIALLVVVVGMLIYDFVVDTDKNMPENHSGYNLDKYKKSDTAKAAYVEVKQINLPEGKPRGLAYYNTHLYYLSADSMLRIYTPKGELRKKYSLPDIPKTLVMKNDTFYVLFKRYFIAYDDNMSALNKSEVAGESAIYTSIAVKDGFVFMADAANKKVVRFAKTGKKQGEFAGISNSSTLHGFIIPSAYFDLAVNGENELWVVNPGMHYVQQYSDDGNLENNWGETGMDEIGFSGCCNPVHFTFTPEGNFITSEKGLVRVKLFSPAGEYLAMVASPEQFPNTKQGPEPVAGRPGNIWLLDFDARQIRLFEKNTQ